MYGDKASPRLPKAAEPARDSEAIKALPAPALVEGFLVCSEVGLDFALEASIEAFQYWRREEPALRDIRLTVAPGELVVITGPAGAGKTTLCHCLAGVIPHFTSGRFQGTVKVAGRDLRTLRLPEIAARVGFVLQRPENQLFNLTVEEDVAFGPENLGLPPSDIRERVARGLAMAGVQKLAKRAPDSLSGGEMQRAVLAAILALDPDLFILDQPAAELDPRGRADLYANLRRLNADQGKTIILVEDRLDDLATCASRLILMENGTIVKDAPPVAFFADERVLHAGIRLPLRAGEPRQPASRVESPPAATLPPLAMPFGHEQCRTPGGPSRREGGNAIEVRDLSFRYPQAGHWSLRGIDLAFGPGEFVAIVGENGAGKTTLAKHLIGLLRPVRGKVLVNGMDIAPQSTARISDVVGYLFQDPDYQLFCDSVFDEVAFGLKIRNLPREQILDRVTATLRDLGLWSVRESHPYTLSRGQRQRVALAVVLVRRPSVLVVDEPSTGLDYRETLGVMNLLDGFCAAGGTALMISHDTEMVARYATRTIVMGGGQVVLDSLVSGFQDCDGFENRCGPSATSMSESMSLSERRAKALLVEGYQRKGFAAESL